MTPKEYHRYENMTVPEKMKEYARLTIELKPMEQIFDTIGIDESDLQEWRGMPEFMETMATAASGAMAELLLLAVGTLKNQMSDLDTKPDLAQKAAFKAFDLCEDIKPATIAKPNVTYITPA